MVTLPSDLQNRSIAEHIQHHQYLHARWNGQYRFDSPSGNDDRAFIQDLIDNANGATVEIGAGTYLLGTGLQILTSTSLRGYGTNRTVLKATAEIASIMQIGQDSVAIPQSIYISDLTLDCNSLATNGILILSGQAVTLRNVYIKSGTNGIYISGQYDRRVLSVLLENCLTYNNTIGVKIANDGIITGSFSQFTLLNCQSESDATGIKISGTIGGYSPRLSITGGSIENSSVACCDLEACSAVISGVYWEPQSSVDNFLVRGGVDASIVDSVAEIKTLTETSRVTVIQSYINAKGQLATSCVLGNTFDDAGWGPPNYPNPSSRPGALYKRGFAYTDVYGVLWTCVASGTSGGSTFAALNGKIVIPLDYSSVTNERRVWFPNVDFVIREIEIVVTSGFTAGTATVASLGISGNHTKWLNVLAAALAGNAVIVSDFAPELLPGDTVDNGASGDGYIDIYTDGSWSTGEALIIIRGDYITA